MRAPHRKSTRLCCGASRCTCTTQKACKHIAYIVRGTDVARASLQGSHPHFLIGNAVSAHDRQIRKIAVQAFNVGQAPKFNVKNYRFRVISQQVVPQFFTGAAYMY